jgi:GNAT superfamily N-acetyltransferase
MAPDTTPDGTPATRIRRAVPGDAPALHELVLALARYEREPDAVLADADDLDRALFADQPLLHAVVAEVEGPSGFEVAGMALWFVTYSTWRGRHGIWLEDLFVLPEYRRLGLGRELLAELAAEALARGYARLEWNVLDWNEPALRFYRSLGAQALSEWTVHRVDDADLQALAVRRPTSPPAP